MVSTRPLDDAGALRPSVEREEVRLPPGEVDAADNQRMQRAMDRRDDERQQQKEGEKRDESEPAAHADAGDSALPRGAEWRNAGEQILFSLGLSTPEAAPAEPPRHELATLVEQIADRVLVGAREDGTMELRIALKETALAGSELRLARAEGGLQLQILPTAGAVSLIERLGSQLTQDLAAKLSTRVVVEVLPATNESSMGGGTDDQRREGRSRGLEALVMSWAAG